MSTVVVTGAACPLGRRVVDRIARDAGVSRVVALDIAPVRVEHPKVGAHRVDVTAGGYANLLADADTIVHLALPSDTERNARRAERVAVDGTRTLLREADAAGVRHVVSVSSALVYGAWPNNAVPLTEDTPLRPNPELAYAVQRAHVEHLLADWAAEDPRRTAAVLRPSVALAEDGSSWIARSLAAAAGLRANEEDPVTQYVHLDDLADAVDVARRQHLDGPYNVAPDGWIAGETARALAGSAPKPRLPARLATRLAWWSWTFQRGPIPRGLLPYTEHPWVVANDRLRRTGWAPRHTNEQAYVAGTEARWWSMLSPARKQELALGVAAAALAALGAGAAVVARALVRRSRTRAQP